MNAQPAEKGAELNLGGVQKSDNPLNLVQIHHMCKYAPCGCAPAPSPQISLKAGKRQAFRARRAVLSRFSLKSLTMLVESME